MRTRNVSQLYDELCKFTFQKPDGITVMQKIMYDEFKKRRVDLLDNNQLEKLLQKLKDHYEHGTASKTISGSKP